MLRSCENCKHIKSWDYDCFKGFVYYKSDFECTKNFEEYNSEDLDFPEIAELCPYYELASPEELKKRFEE